MRTGIRKLTSKLPYRLRLHGTLDSQAALNAIKIDKKTMYDKNICFFTFRTSFLEHSDPHNAAKHGVGESKHVFTVLEKTSNLSRFWPPKSRVGS